MYLLVLLHAAKLHIFRHVVRLGGLGHKTSSEWNAFQKNCFVRVCVVAFGIRVGPSMLWPPEQFEGHGTVWGC